MESNNISKINFLSEKQNNQKNTILISHRLRGFDEHDATRIGLINALTSGIKYIEIDLRITKDKQIVINHDPHLKEHFDSSQFISELTLDKIKKIKYKNSNSTESILTLQELLDLFNQHKKNDSFLFLDIKEYGLEEKIISEIINRNLLNNIIIISWLPEVIYKIHSINPDIKLCFSFIPVLNQLKYFLLKFSFDKIHFNKFISLLSKLFSIKITSYFEYTNFIFNDYIRNELDKYKLEDYAGKDYEHIISKWLNKNFASILQKSKGMICVPYKLIDKIFVDKYHKLGIKVIVFSINEEKILNKYFDNVKPDFILTDKKEFLFK